jgi:AraC-binding-like domain
VTEYLASAPVVATHSVEEAREAVSRIYLRHNLSSRDGALNMRFNATAGGHMTLGYLTYQAEAELTMPPTEDCYIVNLTIAGATRGSRGDGVRGRTAGNERGLVLSPVQNHRVHGPPTQSSCT